MARTIPLSALQHYMYCPRQCALIHVEKVWVENRFTTEGSLLHLRADSGHSGRRGGIAEDRAVPIRSERLGLYGIADVIETRAGPDGQGKPYPVEYKRGSPKIEDWDRAQLCAQAMCLEEMLDVTIREGAIFYGKPRRRENVVFDDGLRDVVEQNCKAMHAMIGRGTIPTANFDTQCRGCSLKGVCMPKACGNVATYLLKGLE